MKFIGRFYFVSSHGRVLQAHTDGEMHAGQEVQNIGLEEKWNVFVWPDGKVSLQNLRTNRWLCAEPSGRAVCDRAQPESCEKWTLHRVNNHVAFLSAHNRWLCAQGPGEDTVYGGEVIADRTVCAEFEQFSMIPIDGTQEIDETWWDSVKSADVAKNIVLAVGSLA